MLSVLASFLAHCLSIYGQFSVVVFEVGTFFIHEYTNAMRTLHKKHVSTNYAQYCLAKTHTGASLARVLSSRIFEGKYYFMYSRNFLLGI